MMRTALLVILATLTAASAMNVVAAAEVEGSDGGSDAIGPTIVLDYGEGAKMNPTEDFMYFVPLISPTLVGREISTDNSQTGTMVSCERTKGSERFSCVCVFKMVGGGTQTYVFDPEGMIEHNMEEQKKGKPMKNLLEYIKFEGEGEGRMEVRGVFKDGKGVVTDAEVHFVNSKKGVSPVTIGLYSIKCKNGGYDSDDGYDRIIARVHTLEFKRCEGEPRMGIKIASLKGATAKEGAWARFKAKVANYFIPPLTVDKMGNDAMLDFGHAMYDGTNTFTFPKAEKLQINTTARTSDGDDSKSG